MARLFLATALSLVPLLLVLPQAVSAEVELSTNQQCFAGGRLNVIFRWTGNDTSAIRQFFDLSTHDNGWAEGTFMSKGPLSNTTTLLESLLPSDTQHFFRINQQLADGSWSPSATFAVKTIACPGSSSTTPPGPIQPGSNGRAPASETATLLGFSVSTATGSTDVAPGASLPLCEPEEIVAYFDVAGLERPRSVLTTPYIWSIAGRVVRMSRTSESKLDGTT